MKYILPGILVFLIFFLSFITAQNSTNSTIANNTNTSALPFNYTSNYSLTIDPPTYSWKYLGNNLNLSFKICQNSNLTYTTFPLTAFLYGENFTALNYVKLQSKLNVYMDQRCKTTYIALTSTSGYTSTNVVVGVKILENKTFIQTSSTSLPTTNINISNLNTTINLNSTNSSYVNQTEWEAQKKKQKKNRQLVLIIVAIIIAGGVIYYFYTKDDDQPSDPGFV